MNNTFPKTAALKVLPRLVALLQSRKLARWHWKYGADEHKHRWTLVIEQIDARIEEIERYIAENMGMDAFRAKREIVE